jgi:hypothetical protein
MMPRQYKMIFVSTTFGEKDKFDPVLKHHATKAKWGNKVTV